MNIVHKLFFKELRNQKKLIYFFCFNICLALITLICLESAKTGIEKLLYSKAKDIMGADIAIRARRAFSDEEKKKMLDFFKDGTAQVSEVVETFSMVFSPTHQMTRLVEIKAVSNLYPLYGQLKTAQRTINSEQGFGFQGFQIYISQDLKNLMGIGVGEFCKIGKQNFEIMGVITDDSSSSWRGLDLAPKLYMSLESLEKTELIAKGSTVSHSLLLQLKSEFQTNQNYLEKQKIFYQNFTDNTIQMTIPRDASNQVSKIFDYLVDFLSLISLMALILAVIGISFLMRGFIHQKCREVAVLKTLGFKNYQINYYFLLYLLFLTIVSFLISNAASSLLLPVIGEYLRNYVTGLELHLNYSSTFKIMIIVLLLNFLANFPFIYQLRTIKEVILLREEAGNLAFGNPRLGFWLPSLLFFMFLCVWQSNSYKIGILFAVSFCAVVLVLWFFFYRFLKFLGGLNFSQNIYLFNLALKRMSRNQASSLISFMSLTLGLVLVVLIIQLKSSLYKEFSVDNKTERASLFIFDIQEEQLSMLQSFLSSLGERLSEASPLIRARLQKINNKDVEATQAKDYETREEESSRRFRNRGINLSFRTQLDPSEEITEGKKLLPFSSEGEALVELSLEERYAKRLEIELEDKLTFDIQGVEMSGVVKNFRKVKWTSFKPNFFILVAPGMLESAPKTYLSTLDSISDERVWKIQNELAKQFPNISSIHVNQLLQKILNLFEQMSVGVLLISFCCILVSLCVITSIFYYQMSEKKKDFSILKVLGMTHGHLKLYFLFDYLILITIATIFCLFLGLSMSYIFLNQVFDLPFQIEASQLGGILLLIYLFNFVISFFGIIHILGTKPRDYLLN